MKIEDVTKAASTVEQLRALERWLKESWYSNDNVCRLIFHVQDRNHVVEMPLTPIRVAVSEQIKEFYAELAKMGVAIKTP